MEIGSKIKKSRTEAGFTQEQVAESLGVSRQTISIVAAFPFIFIMVMTAISTIKALKHDEKVQK